jgi:hypothetical protein
VTEHRREVTEHRRVGTEQQHRGTTASRYGKSRLANDDRDAAKQTAAIIIGKWSDPED